MTKKHNTSKQPIFEFCTYLNHVGKRKPLAIMIALIIVTIIIIHDMNIPNQSRIISYTSLLIVAYVLVFTINFNHLAEQRGLILNEKKTGSKEHIIDTYHNFVFSLTETAAIVLLIISDIIMIFFGQYMLLLEVSYCLIILSSEVLIIILFLLVIGVFHDAKDVTKSKKYKTN